MRGLEPPASWSQTRRASQLRHTPNSKIINFQSSITKQIKISNDGTPDIDYCFLVIGDFMMVPRGRIELPTRGSSGPCSTTELPRRTLQIINNQLPITKQIKISNDGTPDIDYCFLVIGNSMMVGDPGLEPGTSSLSVTRSNQLS